MAEAEREVLERRRKHLIIRVDRADLSKNVLRGFTAFDTFLTQHPEFREEVTFIAHLQPSRQDVPEYAEYLERIEALVAVVNHRHGTTDWMPIDLKIYENFHDAVARYKHFDLLMVNSLFDGMNLVAKEAPAVNTRDGVLMLSENTGSHEELADCVLSVNPFDIQEQADAIYRALTMDPEERRLRAERLKEIIFSRNPGDWVDDQLRRHRGAARSRLSRVGGETPPRPAPWAGVGRVRIRWRASAKVAAVARRRPARRCRLLPALLKPPEPPPLDADVGLPRVARRAGARRRRRQPRGEPPPIASSPPPRPSLADVATPRAASGSPMTAPTRGAHRSRADRARRRVQPAPRRPPPPAPVPPPPHRRRHPCLRQLPSPLPPPGDGSEEFAPH